MSMKVNEVMLGDIVSVSGRPIHVTLAVLNNWSDSIEPIPITKELLEKNGAEDYGFKDFYECNCIDGRITLINDKDYMNSNNEWRAIIRNEHYERIAVCELTYLHELQALLRICKIEHEWQV